MGQVRLTAPPARTEPTQLPCQPHIHDCFLVPAPCCSKCRRWESVKEFFGRWREPRPTAVPLPIDKLKCHRAPEGVCVWRPSLAPHAASDGTMLAWQQLAGRAVLLLPNAHLLARHRQQLSTRAAADVNRCRAQRGGELPPRRAGQLRLLQPAHHHALAHAGLGAACPHQGGCVGGAGGWMVHASAHSFPARVALLQHLLHKPSVPPWPASLLTLSFDFDFHRLAVTCWAATCPR